MLNENLALYSICISENIQIRHKGKYTINIDALRCPDGYIVSAYIYVFPYIIKGFNGLRMQRDAIRKLIMQCINELAVRGEDWSELHYLV